MEEVGAESKRSDANAPTRRQVALVFFYVVTLMLLYCTANIGVAGIPQQFILKNVLKLTPQRLATFGFYTDAPSFIAFAFGFLRDRWRPFRWGDRGYFLFLPLLLAGANLLLAFGDFSYSRMLCAILLTTAISVWLGAAANGLLTSVAQINGMTGRLAVVMLLIPRLLSILSNAIGGHLSDAKHQHTAYLLSAALCLPMLVMAFWKPRAVFARETEMMTRAIPENVGQALKRLARHKAIYLPAIILFLWNFAPGWGTPLFFYLTNRVKLSDAAYGNSTALLGLGTLVFTLGYSAICCRVRLRPLLYWGTLLGVLGNPIFLFIHTVTQAYVISFLAGASLGVGLCAYNDLLIRCCPPELEGAAFLFTTAALTVAGDTSDIFGSWLYEKGGFVLALVVSTAFTALIFVVLPFIPRPLLTPREGEPLRETLPSHSATLPMDMRAEPEVI